MSCSISGFVLAKPLEHAAACVTNFGFFCLVRRGLGQLPGRSLQKWVCKKQQQQRNS